MHNRVVAYVRSPIRFSALQRAEIAEIKFQAVAGDSLTSFSALQRAEIAEMDE